MNTISATELTRNTREILDRVVTRGEIVTIECQGRLNIEPPCRFNNEPGRVAGF